MADKTGIWLLDKPIGVTSRELLDQVARKIEIESMGHSGTLDPMASGLLILLSGQARKVQHLFTGLEKTYRATVQLGAFSDTDDEEGPLCPCLVENIPDSGEVQKVVGGFEGIICQRPPAYSAIKVNGMRAYQLARQGKRVNLAPREVRVHRLEILDYSYPLLSLEIRCSAGVYVRSLARDIGSQLGTGGYVKTLRRISIGHFSVERATTLQGLSASCLISLEEAAAPFPKIRLPLHLCERLGKGQRVPSPPGSPQDGNAFIWMDERIIAWARIQDNYIHPQRLLVFSI